MEPEPEYNQPIMASDSPFGLDELELNRDASGHPSTSWANLGYWEDAQTYPEAARALAIKLGDALDLSPEHSLLDVGFGLGEQLSLWLTHYNVAAIYGLNPAEVQVHHAQALLDQRGQSGKVTLCAEPARAMERLTGERFHRVIALDTAYHFQTRRTFMNQALRLLTPGGKLGLIDIIPTKSALKVPQRLLTRMAAKLMHIPRANLQTQDAYVEMLDTLAFEQIEVNDISVHVFPGFAHYVETHPDHTKSSWRKMRLTASWLTKLHQWKAIRAVLIVATKPS